MSAKRSCHSGAELLSNVLSQKKQKNANYTLRAFARDLEIPPGRLSEFISGKRKVSKRMYNRLIEKLSISPSEARKVFDQALIEQSDSHFYQMSDDQFFTLADPIHFFILCLFDTEDFQSNTKWMAKRLNADVVEVKLAFERLVRVGLVETRDGVLVKRKKNIATTDQIANVALRKSHEQTLKHAEEALWTTEIEDRDISSVTMAADISQIPRVKKEIKKFRRRIMALLENEKASEVYNLNIQLVPVTRKIKENVS